MQTLRISTRYFPLMESLGVAGTAVIVGLGGLFADQNIVSVGTVAAFVLYLNNLFEPVQQLSQQYNTVQSSGAASTSSSNSSTSSRRSASAPARSTSRSTGTSRSITSRSCTARMPTCCTTSASRSCRGSGSHSSGRPARGSRRWRSWSCASTTRARVHLGGRGRPARRDAALVARDDRRRTPGGVPLHRHDPRQREGGQAGRDRRRGGGRDRRARCARPVPGATRRPRHRGSRAWHATVGGGAPARLARARCTRRSRGARARRGDVEPRPGDRERGRARARAPHREAHRHRGRAPAVDRRSRRPRRGRRRRRPGRARPARRARTAGGPLRRSSRRGPPPAAAPPSDLSLEDRVRRGVGTRGPG